MSRGSSRPLPPAAHRPVLARLRGGLVALVAATVLASPAAQAAPKRLVTPQIAAFEMDSVNQVQPGTELFFRVQGTPGARATVRIVGVNRTLVLQEVDDGVYEGAYVLRPGDRVQPQSSATASLRLNQRVSTSVIPRVAAAAPAPVPQLPRPSTLAIGGFRLAPVERVEPGAKLRFLLDGTAGARATLNLGDTALPMRETSPGHYEASYTVRRSDRIGSNLPVTATLEAGGAVVRQTLSVSPFADVDAPRIARVQPRDGETVRTDGPVTIAARFADLGGSGVDPRSVRIVVGGRDLTAQASVTEEGFSLATPLAAGSHAADVSARDRAGNAFRTAWTFAVQPAGNPVAAAPFGLEVTSHASNAQVRSGPVTVEGRTAPGAVVEAEVTAFVGMPGAVGVQQRVHAERLVADANGRFAFGFDARIPVPGVRYEVSLRAQRGQETRSAEFSLLQQR